MLTINLARGWEADIPKGEADDERFEGPLLRCKADIVHQLHLSAKQDSRWKEYLFAEVR